MDDTLVETMLLTIRRFSMMETGDRVLVAVSGGPDSVALLHALLTAREELGISLHVAHLNHCFRGAESDADAEYVRQLAANIGVESSVQRIDVPEIQKVLRLSTEEAARLVRYEFLDRAADEVGANRIAVGHTADDQVETVLLNLLRGSGIDGLAGMPPVRGRIIRPLIETRRSEVEAYCERHGLHPRTDATNLVAEYTRNRIRLDLLPLLRRDYNPEIDSALLRLAELAAADATYLNIETEEVLRRLTTERGDGFVTLDAVGLVSFPLAVRRRVIREAVKAVRGGLGDIGFVHVDELVRLLEAGSDFEYGFPGGVFVRRTRAALSFRSSRPEEIPIIYCYELPVPGSIAVPEIGAEIRAEVSAEPLDHVRPRGSSEVVLDSGKVSGKLRVRNWQPGDRIRPLGMSGSKKVQDLFVDAKIPRDARHRIPLIVDDDKVVWVAGLALSDQVKVTDETREFLVLGVEPSRAC